MGDDWKPRRHDHLVEPMFAGLEVERANARRAAGRRRLVLGAVALLLLLALLVVSLSG